ncbi:MAG: T9SS type A sorting domain-containing protein, partial [Bacteroidota bacterium]|nr:T9SS type A sorting domain-containing protein [Bacteroidota bacterium]
TGSLEISLADQQSFFDSDTLVVFSLPEVSITQFGDQLCTNDSALVDHTWFLDGDTILNSSGPCVQISGPGIYHVIALDGYGCAGESEAFIVCPDIEITQTENVLHVTAGYVSYAWSLNGVPITDEDQPFLIIQETGIYSVEVNAGDGCIITATQQINVGLRELHRSGGSLMIQPNPSNGQFQIIADGFHDSHVEIRIFNLIGEVMFEQNLNSINGQLQADLAVNLPAGAYLVQLRDEYVLRSATLVMQ